LVELSRLSSFRSAGGSARASLWSGGTAPEMQLEVDGRPRTRGEPTGLVEALGARMTREHPRRDDALDPHPVDHRRDQTAREALRAPRVPDADLVEQKLARRLFPHREDVAEREAHALLPGKRDPGQEVRIGEERRCRAWRERRSEPALPLQVEILILLREDRE